MLLDLCVTLASEAAPLLQAHKTLATHAKEADKLQALAAGTNSPSARQVVSL